MTNRQPTEPAGKLQQYHDTAWEICLRLTSKHGCLVKFQWQKRDANNAPDALAKWAVSSRTDGFQRVAGRASDGAIHWHECELQKQQQQQQRIPERSSREAAGCSRFGHDAVSALVRSVGSTDRATRVGRIPNVFVT